MRDPVFRAKMWITGVLVLLIAGMVLAGYLKGV